MSQIVLPESLIEQLRAFERRLRSMETAATFACGAAGVLTTFLLLFAFDRVGDTPRWLRIILTLSGGGLAAWFAAEWSRNWIWNRRGPAELARLLQRHFRSLGDRLQGIIELTESGELPANISPALLRAAIAQVAVESGRFEFTDAVPVRPVRRWTIAAATLAVLAAAPFVIVPKAGLNALARWLAPWAHIERYTFASLDALPAELVVPHGEPFEIVCGIKPDSAWRPTTASARLNRRELNDTPLRGGKAVFKIEGQTANGTLAIRIGDASREMAIHPLHRPEMRELAAHIRLPGYLNYPETTAPIQGSSAEFLEGSSVSFSGKTSRALASASMKAGENEPAANVSGPTFITAPEPAEGLGKQAVFQWADQFGLTPTQPYAVKVNLVKDAAPRVDLQGVDAEMAILPDEVIKLNIAATDDFGLKDAWVGWSARSLGDKKKDLAQGESAHTAGNPQLKQITATAPFSPASLNIPEDTAVDLAAFAVDYMPDRKPSASWKYTLYVLSPAKHAERVRERMDQALKELNERIRDEERQMDETKAINDDKKDLAAQEKTEDIKRVESGERTNEAQLKKLTDEMGDILKDALRNKEIPEGTVADWQQLTDKLEQQADPPMQEASESLAQAGAQPSQREERLSESQQNQQKAIDAMREASKTMKQANQNLYARNFYNRLRAAAGAERDVSDKLKTLAKETAGLKPEEIGDAQQKAFENVALKQDDSTKDVDKIVSDMEEFVKRVPDEKYVTVQKEMQDKKVVSELSELSGYVRANLGLKSVRSAHQWSDQLDTWATMLQSECHSQGGGNSEMDPDLMELLIAMVRAAQAEDNIREQTGLLESKKDSDADYAKEARKLSGQQDQLYWSVDALREKTKFAEAKPTLKQVESLMDEVTGDLRKPQTDSAVANVEGAAIELLVPPDKKGGKDSKAQQMMRKMMAQVTRAKKAGGNNGKSSSTFAGADPDGAAAKLKAPGRNVDKTGGAVNSGEWPEEFRDQLQAYFQASEDAQK